MHGPNHWMGSPRAAGFVAGSWCWAAATLAMHRARPAAPWGADLLQWLGSDGAGPAFLPIAVAVLVALVHAVVIRQAEGRCCREWTDAAWSLVTVAVGIGAWTWALRYEPFADPLSVSRRLAALAGLGAMLVGTGMALGTALEADRRHRTPRAARELRRSYEAIG